MHMQFYCSVCPVEGIVATRYMKLSGATVERDMD